METTAFPYSFVSRPVGSWEIKWHEQQRERWVEDSGLNTGHNFTKQTHSFGETDGLQNTHTHTGTLSGKATKQKVTYSDRCITWPPKSWNYRSVRQKRIPLSLYRLWNGQTCGEFSSKRFFRWHLLKLHKWKLINWFELQLDIMRLAADMRAKDFQLSNA